MRKQEGKRRNPAFPFLFLTPSPSRKNCSTPPVFPEMLIRRDRIALHRQTTAHSVTDETSYSVMLKSRAALPERMFPSTSFRMPQFM